jgi:hypothetical protein
MDKENFYKDIIEEMNKLYINQDLIKLKNLNDNLKELKLTNLYEKELITQLIRELEYLLS